VGGPAGGQGCGSCRYHRPHRLVGAASKCKRGGREREPVAAAERGDHGAGVGAGGAGTARPRALIVRAPRCPGGKGVRGATGEGIGRWADGQIERY
jgi:hypothetical protein